ncbi:MAG: response regulator [Bacteroidetes bacterium]|nr:MAG: response regulator [Bacteroidota bacterium]
MERFINILIVDKNASNRAGLKEILNGSGNNVLIADSLPDAWEVMQQKEIGILIFNIDPNEKEAIDYLERFRKDRRLKLVYKVVMTEKPYSSGVLVKCLNAGAVDFLTLPFNPNLVKAKIDIYKSLYYKDGRIRQLLENIFPEKVLDDLNTHGKFSPKRISNGVVLFTDFVNFSTKAKALSPMKLLKRLEYFFTRFDEITTRYQIEKIKTIGDSYMALAGVTEELSHPEIRACLAAIEMRDFVNNERDVSKALGKDYWEIRIGIHAGPLVAGVIGSRKYSFDVWGDTVNIAARAEQSAENDHILITSTIVERIDPYFDIEFHGPIPIKKRGGKIDMYRLERLKLEHCLYGEGKIANKALLKACQLPGNDFDHMQKDIMNRLRSMLPEELIYHDINHTINVEKSALRLARLEGVSDYDLMILRTAVYYHDAGFLVSYYENEVHAIRMARNLLPYFGFDEDEIERIAKIIEVTDGKHEPETLLQKIMRDSDHDYLGRADYYQIAQKLRLELENMEVYMNELEWIDFQLNFLENKHQYYTETAKNIRQSGKNARILELYKSRNELLEAEKN